MNGLQDKSVLIAGGTGGIGSATALVSAPKARGSRSARATRPAPRRSPTS